MRSFAIIVPIVLVVVLAWGFTSKFIDKHTKYFFEKLETLNEQVSNEKWEEAFQSFSRIDEKWQSIRKLWTILLDHHEMDNIDLSMARLRKYIETENTSLSLGELAVLEELFKIVKENEALTLSNIL